MLPYHYILDSDIRHSLQVNLRNAILVFDEAHNIESNCEEILSFEMQVENFWKAFKYLDAASKEKKTK